MHVQGTVGQRFEDLGPRRAGRVGRDQPDRRTQVLGVVGQAEVVLQPATDLQEERGPDRFSVEMAVGVRYA